MPAFLYSPLLWGLLLVALPVLIHLINMLRHRRVEWAAIEFLLVSQKKNRTWVLIKQLLLLLLRMAVVAAVVLAVAQPILRDKWSGWFGSGKTHHIILLDDSYSMSDTRGEKDLFDSAKDVARRIVATASDRQRPQALTLARFSRLSVSAASDGSAMASSTATKHTEASGGSKSAAANKNAMASIAANKDTTPSGAAGEYGLDFASVDVNPALLQKLKERLASMNVSESTASVKDALSLIEPLLSGDQTDEDRVVYLVSDFRDRDWAAGEAIRAALKKLAGNRTRIELIDCSQGESSNLAVTQIKQVPGVLASGVPCLLEATIRNYGKSPVRNVTLSIEQDGIARSVSKIERIDPGEEKTERFAVRFPTPGPHSVAVRINADPIAADNRRFLVVNVPEDVPVLVIDGSSTGESSRFLTSALAPGGSAKTGIRPRVEPPSFLTRAAIDRFAVIYFTDIERLEPAAIERLERYASTGGSVVFFTGPMTSTQYVNDHLYRLGQGIFPLKLAGRAELMADPVENLPDLESADHPIFRIFAGKLNSFLNTVNIETYMAVDDSQKKADQKIPPVEVLARLRGGAPLVVESTFGQGRVITVLSTVAPTWNNWARGNPSFVVTMLEMQTYLSRRPREETVHQVGQPLVVELDAEAYRGTVRFDAPKAKNRPKPTGSFTSLMTTVDALRTDDGQWIASFDQTDHAGVYRIQLTTTKDLDELRKMAINIEPSEGEMRLFRRENLDTTLSGVPFHYAQASHFEADTGDTGGTNLQDAVLVLLILMLLGEQILAWSCSYHPPHRVKGGSA